MAPTISIISKPYAILVACKQPEDTRFKGSGFSVLVQSMPKGVCGIYSNELPCKYFYTV